MTKLDVGDLIPVSEAISQLLEPIGGVIRAANDVLIEKRSFLELKGYLERIVPILKELSKKKIYNSETLYTTTEVLDREIKVAKQLVEECSKRNRVYLLVNCRRIVKRLENTTKEISNALGLLPLASLDLSTGIKEELEDVCRDMHKAEFRTAVAEEEILEKIESGVQERNVDRAYANKLLTLIADAIGISTERTMLKKEFEEFKNEINDVQLRKDQAEAIQMEQIIALLERADATSSPKEKEVKYFNRRESLGRQPLDPLQAFYCPITHDVMVDPVETSSGHTFERSAIQKWLADGNKLCPLTMTPLNPSILRPNKTLRQSIEEWKDRNTIISIAFIKPSLQSEDEQEVLRTLDRLQELCEEKDVHREWIALENYLPLLIDRLTAKKREIREKALVLLSILVKDNDDSKDRIADVKNAIELIVRSLARQTVESKLAVTLLLELSKSGALRERIGKVQGCILLLVTRSNSDDTQAARDAKELLENLTFLDQNIIQMARVNYFKPLVQRLSSGPKDVKLIMAATVAEMEMGDHNKAALVKEGVLGPILHLISHDDPEMKKVAVKALQNLSSLRENGLQMIREGAVVLLLDLLYSPKSSAPSLREEAAATVMNIAISTKVHEPDQIRAALLENDDDIFRLFSLINMTGSSVQQSILRTIIVMCQPSSAAGIRLMLRQYSALHVLIQLCEFDDISVRANAVKLFFCLTQDGGDDTFSENMGQKFIVTLLRIINNSSDEEEISAAIGIISNLPLNSSQMTEWLLEAGALSIILKFLTDRNYAGVHKNQQIERAVTSLHRFSLSTNQELQKRVARMGFIPLLINLLGSGTPLTKQRAATALTQFSKNTTVLSRKIEKRGGLWCFAPHFDVGCPVHMGICTVESSFCLLEADAIGPLVGVLEEADIGACEASLEALLTLIDGEKLQNGSKVLDEANAIAPMIRLLNSPSTHLQEITLRALERIFRLVEFKQKYGALAQTHLVDITQRGTSTMKPLAARMLSYLNVLPEQSSFF